MFKFHWSCSKGPVPNWLLRDFEQFLKKNITHNYYLHKKKNPYIGSFHSNAPGPSSLLSLYKKKQEALGTRLVSTWKLNNETNL